MTDMDMSVRALSILAGLLIAWQLLNPKGSPTHVVSGALAGASGILLFLAVTVRGYATYGQAHGSLYPVHLFLGVVLFLSLAITVWSGLRIRSLPPGGRYPAWRGRHKVSARVCAASFVLSLAAGILSYLSRA